MTRDVTRGSDMVRPDSRVLLRMLLALLLLSAGADAASPRVVSSTVEDGQDDVDPALAEIRIEFDQRMDSRSMSVVGGGPSFPELRGKPRWADERTFVIAVKLKPDHEYWMSINSDTFQGFRSQGSGESAVPQPLAFRTRAAGAPAEPADPLTPERNRDAADVLRKAVDDNYAYRDRLGLDWEKLFAEHAAALEGATTPNQFARAVARLLRAAEDGHVYVGAGGRTIGTHVNARPPNVNVETLRRSVADWTEHGGVASGTLADDVGYLLIPQWGRATADALDRAFATVKDSKGLVIDVRLNGGGDEVVAREFAGRFVDEAKVYSKNRIRRDGQWHGPFERVVEPRPDADRYRGPVAVLVGPKVGSSCESFVLMMRQGPRCTLVGGTTKGSSGNPRPFDLGNGVTAFLSSWEDLLPDDTVMEGRGVTPDVQVKTTLADLRRRDAVLDAAVKVVREPSPAAAPEPAGTEAGAGGSGDR
jgi:hypothetical protein